jgi:hypothetical protein
MEHYLTVIIIVISNVIWKEALYIIGMPFEFCDNEVPADRNRVSTAQLQQNILIVPAVRAGDATYKSAQAYICLKVRHYEKVREKCLKIRRY